MDEVRLRAGRLPPRAWALLGVWLLAVAGAMAVTIVGGMRAVDVTIAASRTPVGATTRVALEPGPHTVYVEAPRPRGARRSGRSFQAAVAVRDPGGALVPLRPYGSSTTFSSGGRTAYGFRTFDAPVAGTYEVSASPGAVDLGEQAVVVGRGGQLRREGLAIGAGVAVGLVGALLGAVWAVRAHRRLRGVSRPG